MTVFWSILAVNTMKLFEVKKQDLSNKNFQFLKL